MFAVIMIILWILIGGYNLVLADKVSNLSYFCCWFTLLLYIMACSVL